MGPAIKHTPAIHDFVRGMVGSPNSELGPDLDQIGSLDPDWKLGEPFEANPSLETGTLFWLGKTAGLLINMIWHGDVKALLEHRKWHLVNMGER